MTSPDGLYDTADYHERLETELLAQDSDAAQVSTADVDETMARQFVSDLVDNASAGSPRPIVRPSRRRRS